MNKTKEIKALTGLQITAVIITILVVITAWILNWYLLVCNSSTLGDRGTFGDMFGAVNALFSGLAFAGIIFTILLQRNELKLQRTELSETRSEFKDQNFQDIFFNLLKTQQQLTNDISVSLTTLSSVNNFSTQELRGRKFFNMSRQEYNRIVNALDHTEYLAWKTWDENDDYSYEEHLATTPPWEEDVILKRRKISYTLHYYKISIDDWEKAKTLKELELAKFIYQVFLGKFNFAIGHYFRHFYHILVLLENAHTNKEEEMNENVIDKEFLQFANFVQAQMSTPELFLLFYRSLSFPDLQRLLIKYKILENLPEENLIDASHNILPSLKLKKLIDIVF